MTNKNKYYVVWAGLVPGIYDNWVTCKMQIDGFDGAKYKSFESKELANQAYKEPYTNYISMRTATKKKNTIPSDAHTTPPFIVESIAVDAACSGNPGKMEYRGVYVKNNKELFKIGPLEDGTNNIGEFLALVHGLALLKQNNSPLPIYTDSVNAISWIKQRKCKTKLLPTARNKPIFELIERAELWLKNNPFSTQIIKWETKIWGEIPADFGRK